MSRDLTLESWNTVPLLSKPFHKVDHVLFLEKLLQVVEQLPKSDVYVFESKIYRYTSLRVVPFLTNLRILEAMLVTLLNSQLAITGQHHAFFLKPNSVMRFFNLAVGGERVSGQHILRDLQRSVHEDSGNTSMVADVEVPAGLWEQYWQEQSIGQEKLANCFLLAVAFYKLVVLRTHSLQF
ncbi:hypothetical protein BaRGS_00002553 [Batillaria attramentaria]|uniref:Uncharacterized protein n=1 Tax=Batillaria attramentaria TaxID=370345 RepID=A0ABD0M3T4_9CAEN|nr:hypothetical protein BaRGS_024979 [Batillaria attramentaria]